MRRVCGEEHQSNAFQQATRVILSPPSNECHKSQAKRIPDNMRRVTNTNKCLWLYKFMQMKASVSRIIIVLLSAGGARRCQCVAQPPYNQPPQLLKQRRCQLSGDLTFNKRFYGGAGHLGGGGGAGERGSTLSTFTFQEKQAAQSLKGGPRYVMKQFIPEWEHTMVFIFSCGVHFKRNLSIFSSTEPEARINISTPQCWSQFLLKIFQVRLKRPFVIAPVTKVNFRL